jgi:uncharacterized protein (DUF1684 family)
MRMTFALLLFFLTTNANPQTAPAYPLEHELLNLSTSELNELFSLSHAAKDSLLRHGEDSPLLPEAKTSFQGLNYYPVNPNLRLVGELHIYGHLRQIQVPTTASTVLPMERFGRIHFLLQGKPFWLEAYRSQADDHVLVLFNDSTNGQQTYGGGRYMPLTPLGNGYYLVDFNTAYNPYCTYNPEYICPLPPSHNTLDLEIRAGEKNYGADLAY